MHVTIPNDEVRSSVLYPNSIHILRAYVPVFYDVRIVLRPRTAAIYTILGSESYISNNKE